MIKKYIKTLFLILTLMFFNIGSKYPAMSEGNDGTSVQLYADRLNEEANMKAEAERYMKMYQEIYEESYIQQVEFESELVIPDYFDFKYVEFTSKTAEQFGISRRMAFRLIFKESSFDDSLTSPAGAKGLTQLMPKTRKIYYDMLCVDTLNLDKNQEDIYIGLYYLKDLREMWKERGNSEKVLWKLALAGYNAGPQKVILYKGIPPYKQTIDFVNFINSRHSNPVFYSNILKKNANKDVS